MILLFWTIEDVANLWLKVLWYGGRMQLFELRRKGTTFPFQFSPLIPFPLVLVLRELESRARPAILKRRKIEKVRNSSPTILRKRTFFFENLKTTRFNSCLYALNDRY